MPIITIENLDKTIEVSPALNLLNNFRIKGIPIGSQCGGRGNCGTCRFAVKEGKEFLTPINSSERFRLTPRELDSGWRLACQSYAIKNLLVLVPPPDPDEERY